MKFLGAILVVLFGTNSFAAGAATKFMCSNVGGTAEWTIYVDLNKKVAGFFDNDTTVVVPMTDLVSFDTLPPQWEYTFEGKDANGGKNARIKIIFNL